MAIPFSIPTLIAEAKIAQYLWANNVSKSKIFNGTNTPNYSQLLYIVRKLVEWKYNNTTVAEVRASASITVTSVPANGSNIMITVDDPVLGILIFGSYAKQGSDTTTTILATSIKNAISSTGYNVASALNVVTIIAPVGYGATINGGGRLSVTATVIPEVRATTQFNVFGIPFTVGLVMNVTVNDPALGVITLGTYTQDSSDTNNTILTTHLKAAITGNSYGYGISGGVTDIITTAAMGRGSSINGNHFTIDWGTGNDFTLFSGGVNEIGLIPVTLGQFSGGVNAINPNADDTRSLVLTGDYLYSLIGKYKGQADALYAGSGCVPPTIISSPLSQTVGAGGTVTFVTVAIGSNLSYQWQKNSSDISGAIAASYSIIGLVSGDAGEYRCIVTNPCGGANTLQAVLTVGAGDIVGYYYFGGTDYFSALNGGTDTVTYNATFPIVSGQPLSVPFPIGASNDVFNIVKYPVSQGIKTGWDNQTPNLGPIPGDVYHSIVTIGSFYYIISSVTMSFNPDFPVIYT